MVFDRFRKRLRDRFAIAEPAVAEIPTADLVGEYLAVAAIGRADALLLSTAATTADLASLHASLVPGDLSLSKAYADISPVAWHALAVPGTRLLPAEILTLSTYPETIDLLEAIRFGGLNGRSYDSDAETEPGPQEEFGPLDEERCRHGMPKYMCEICTSARKRTSQPSTRKAKRFTINLFDLLLPYLQPPLQTLLEQPALFPADRRPFDYQIQGIKWLVEHERGLLGDEMGLGKTIQAIVALQLLFRRGSVRRCLILCRLSLLGNWEHEINKWAPELFALKVRGAQADREVMWKQPAPVFLATYDTLRQDLEGHRIVSPAFDVAILDEVQDIKNPDAGKSKAVRQIRARYRWGLSGTPFENRPEDVLSIFRFLRPDSFAPGGYYSPQDVKRKIAPYMLRRRTADVRTELPEKVVTEVLLDLTDAQRDTYDRCYSDARERLSAPDATRIHVFKMINQLKQICNLDPKTQESCKLDYLEDELDSLHEEEQKSLIFSAYPNETLRKIEPRLSRFNPAVFDGSLREARRDELVRRFQEDEIPEILLSSIKTAGVGLNLTRATHVFHYDHWWNPATEWQAEGRAHRIGQNNTVFVHSIYTRDTIEERIHDIILRKQALFKEIIDDLSVEYEKGLFTDEDLFGLFDLKPPQDSRRTKPNPPASGPPKSGGPQNLGKAVAPYYTRTDSVTDSGNSRPKPGQSPSEWLRELSPQDFEKLVAQLYTLMGFVTALGPQTRDKGIDITARHQGPIGTEIHIIQCKHYPDRHIGPSIVRELIGVWEQRRGDVTRAVLVTSGWFTNAATSEANQSGIDLIDQVSLIRMLQQYQII